MRPADDGVHRRAQLVRQVGEELVLQARGFFRLRAGRVLALIRRFALDGRVLAIADVHDERHPAIVGLGNCSRTHHRPGARAVLANVLLLERRNVSAVAQLQARRLAALETFGRGDAGPGEAGIGEILLGVADETQESVVRFDDAIEPADGDADDVRVDEAAPARFALHEAALRAVQPEQHLHDRRELDRLDRLGEIDLRTAFEPHDLVVRRNECRGDLHDRRRARERIAFYGATDFDAAHVRQVHVTEHEVGGLLAHGAQSFLAG